MAIVAGRRRRRRVSTEKSDPAPLETDVEIVRLTTLVNSYKNKVKNPLTGIRAFCVECMGGYVELVNKCPSVNCSLYPFRKGKNTMSARYGRANPNAFKGGKDDD
jgi:hypothetical protein